MAKKVQIINVSTVINVYENGTCDYESNYCSVRPANPHDMHAGGSSHKTLSEAVGESAKQAVLAWKEVTQDFRT